MKKLFSCQLIYGTAMRPICGRWITTVAKDMAQAIQNIVNYVAKTYKPEYITYDIKKGLLIVDNKNKTAGGRIVFLINNIKIESKKAFQEREFQRASIDKSVKKAKKLVCETKK